MNTNNPIKLGVDTAMRRFGFSQKSMTWFRDLEEVVLVAELQKSNYGNQYYVNLGVLVKGLPRSGKKMPPKEHECHIRSRLESPSPEMNTKIKQALDLDDQSIDEEERRHRVEKAVSEIAIPFLLQCGSCEKIRAAHLRGALDNTLMHKDVRSQWETS
jgi:hypothetical protein